MEVTILGTSAAEGWPAPFCRCSNCRAARTSGGRNIRTRSCVILNGRTMVDMPPDILCQCNRHGLDLFELENLLLTHPHPDHFYPGELLWRRRHYAHPWDGRMLHVYGCEKIRRIIDAELGGQWVESRLDFHPVTRWQTLPLEGNNGKVTAVEARHTPDFECFNFLFEVDGATLLLASPTGWYSDDAWERLGHYHIDAVIMDCTNGVVDTTDVHLSISGVLRAKQKMHYMGIVDGDVTFVATHFSHNGGLLHDDLARALEPGGIVPAYDGMTIEV